MIASEIGVLIENGVFKKLLSAGVISSKIKIQFEIYNRYLDLRLKNANDKKEILLPVNLKIDWSALQSVGIEYKVSDMTVYRAIKAMVK